MDPIKRDLPEIYRGAEIRANSFNEENNTIEVIFSTGAQVERGGFWTEPFIEELSLEKKHVRLNRLNNGAPFLNNHSDRGLEDVLGVVQKATVDGKIGTAVVRLSERESIQGIVTDIKKGIIRNISVGYRVHTFKKVDVVERGDDLIPVLRAIDWEPIEISGVPAGADDGAKVRSENQTLFPCEVIGMDAKKPENDGNKTLPVDNSQRSVDDPGAPPKKSVDADPKLADNKTEGDPKMNADEKREIEKAAQKAEMERGIDIRKAVEVSKVDSKLANEYIAKGLSVDEARAEIFKVLEKKDTETPTRNLHVETGEDQSEKTIRAMGTAFLHKQDPKMLEIVKEGDKTMERSVAGNPFVYRSILECARICLEQRGIKTEFMNKSQLAERALHTTSDFVEILANVANKSLRFGYQEAPQTFGPITRRTQVNDFKEISRTNLGDAPELEEILENGEIKRGSISENAEKYNVREYAKIIGLTRKTLINDDLDAFAGLPSRMGRRARDLESDLAWAIITANAALSDGFALFQAANHNNLIASGAPPDVPGLGVGRSKMRSQVGLDGAKITLTPVWIAVPTELETVAEQLISLITPQEQGKVNPFGPTGRTPQQLIVEPRLSDNSAVAWYMFADVGQIDIIEMATLQGTDGPSISSREGFDVSGMELKIMHDIGVKALDFRGAFKNNGT